MIINEKSFPTFCLGDSCCKSTKICLIQQRVSPPFSLQNFTENRNPTDIQHFNFSASFFQAREALRIPIILSASLSPYTFF